MRIDQLNHIDQTILKSHFKVIIDKNEQPKIIIYTISDKPKF